MSYMVEPDVVAMGLAVHSLNLPGDTVHPFSEAMPSLNSINRSILLYPIA